MADEELNQATMAKQQKNMAKHMKHENMIPKSNQHDHKTEEKKLEEVKEESKKEVKKKEEKKVKKTEAVVYGRALPISTRQAVEIGRFIKYKKISYAIELLEKVVKKKIAVPFRGEFPHRKGKDLKGNSMMGGKFPQNASKEFIRLLKALSANSNANGMDLENTIVIEVIPNKSGKQYHRFGSTQFKRTHLMIKSKEMPVKGAKK